MCISNYFSRETKIYIQSLEDRKATIQKHIICFNPSGALLFIMRNEIKRIDGIIQSKKEKAIKGQTIIESVPDPIARQLLLYRYIEAKPWQSIADIMNYSEGHIYELHKKALELFDAAESVS